MSERRGFTATLLGLLGSACSRHSEPTTQRVATRAHEPWLLWPSGQPPAGGWPTLLFLHGQGEAAWTLNGAREVEQGPDSVLAHGSPVALYRARDARVKTLWQNFVLLAPQAVNDVGMVRFWRWGDPSIKQRVAAQVEQLFVSGKVNADRLYAAGFSRGGLGCFQLDAGNGPLQFRKIVTADAQSLDGLAASLERRRGMRIYYARSTYEDILAPHLAAEKAYGKSAPSISFVPTAVQGKDGDAHIAMCSRVFGDDEVYRWLLA